MRRKKYPIYYYLLTTYKLNALQIDHFEFLKFYEEI